MLKLFLYCFLFMAGPATLNCYTTPEPNIRADLEEFNIWRHTYDKIYPNQLNISNYFNAWRENRDFVKQHNEEHTDFMLELNAFADRLWDDRHQHSSYNKHLARKYFTSPNIMDEEAGLPKSVDWRTKGVVTPVKNQGQCGSCWTFSATGSMEGQYALKTGKLLSFSESQIVDCDETDAGCGGGFIDDAFKYIITNGIENEKSYPYVPLDENCTYSKANVVAHFRNYTDVKGGETGLKGAVAKIGPVSVAIDASAANFQLYKEGVYYNSACSQNYLDHAVLVVGYGTTHNGTDYWIVKNSWGKSWGNNGYILMSRNRNNNCGIATEPSYPIV